MELIEDQLRRGALGNSTQSKLPPPPPKSPLPAPQPSLPSRIEHVDQERAERQGRDRDWEILSYS